MEFVLLAQLTSLLVHQPPTELLAYQDSIYPLHGPTVLLVHSEFQDVPLQQPPKFVLLDTMLLQSLDLMLLVLLVQLLEMLLLVTMLPMLLLVNQDLTQLTELVNLAQLMLTLVMEELS